MLNIIDYLPIDGKSRSEDQIERIVEKVTDILDAYFMRDGSPMRQADYDAAQSAISRWADIEYRFSVENTVLMAKVGTV